MIKPQMSRKRAVRAVIGAGLGIALLAGCMIGAARADDDDEELLDTKIFNGILQSLGLRPSSGSGIDYRERSPLVVPPSRDLPAPNTKSAARNNPAWPNDFDIKKSKEAKAARKTAKPTGDRALEAMRPLRPDELRGSGAPGSTGPLDDRRASSETMRPSELGYKGGIFSSIFSAGKDEDYATFTGEAPRTRLIEPPTGYRTPSPYQPYGVGKEKYAPPKIEDRSLPAR
jgi:hypothetical protein